MGNLIFFRKDMAYCMYVEGGYSSTTLCYELYRADVVSSTSPPVMRMRLRLRLTHCLAGYSQGQAHRPEIVGVEQCCSASPFLLGVIEK